MLVNAEIVDSENKKRVENVIHIKKQYRLNSLIFFFLSKALVNCGKFFINQIYTSIF